MDDYPGSRLSDSPSVVVLDQWIKWLVETHMDDLPCHRRGAAVPGTLPHPQLPASPFPCWTRWRGPLLIIITLVVIGFVTWLALRTEPHH